MTSDKIAYGSRVPRHGKSRAFWPYQAKTASCIAAERVTATAARYRSRRLLRTPCDHQVAIHVIGRRHVAVLGDRVGARRSTAWTIRDGAPKRVKKWRSTRHLTRSSSRWTTTSTALPA
jgi:hypothetical protein